MKFLPLYSRLIQVFEVLSLNPNLKFVEKGKVNIVSSDNKILFSVTPEDIVIPQNVNPLDRFSRLSSLKDQFIDLKLLENLIKNLSEKEAILRLNHIGFCYKVESKNSEKEKIKNDIVGTQWHLYEEESNDQSLWLFIGNAKNWEDPLIELLPVEDANDEWIEYWLPHIHIDIDTTLSDTELLNIAKASFKGQIEPFAVTIIDNITYTIRSRLGVISGVNIDLDLSTKNRDTKYVRENMGKIV